MRERIGRVRAPRRRGRARLRFGYADPPYRGMAGEYAEKAEIDHVELIRQLEEFDGWALHTHVPALPDLLELVDPEIVRVLAWVKPWAAMRPGRRLVWAWEPVLLRPLGSPWRRSVRDWAAVSASVEGRRLLGAKPVDMAYWIFDAAGLRPGDELVDLFPGTGAITRAWKTWSSQATPIVGASSARPLSLWPEGRRT